MYQIYIHPSLLPTQTIFQPNSLTWHSTHLTNDHIIRIYQKYRIIFHRGIPMYHTADLIYKVLKGKGHWLYY